MLIGLTGGIACGKSTVSGMLAARGAHVIDADQVAREVVAPGTPGLEQVRAAFGDEIISDGALDRAALARRIYEAPEARLQLQGILHPLIAEESRRQIAAASAPLIVYDAALLVESGRADEFRPLVVVYASPQTQIARLMARDGVDEAAAQARLAAQMPIDDKARFADHLIRNDGALRETEAQVERLWRAWI